MSLTRLLNTNNKFLTVYSMSSVLNNLFTCMIENYFKIHYFIIYNITDFNQLK